MISIQTDHPRLHKFYSFLSNISFWVGCFDDKYCDQLPHDSLTPLVLASSGPAGRGFGPTAALQLVLNGAAHQDRHSHALARGEGAQVVEVGPREAHRIEAIEPGRLAYSHRSLQNVTLACVT